MTTLSNTIIAGNTAAGIGPDVGFAFTSNGHNLIGKTDGSSGADTIIFASLFNTPQTITLTGTQLELSNTTGTQTITGPAAGVTVSGGGLSRVFKVDASVTASISGLTITAGNVAAGNGGGLYNSGTLTLTSCTVSGNFAADNGGGIYNGFGTATLTNCTLSDNR